MLNGDWWALKLTQNKRENKAGLMADIDSAVGLLTGNTSESNVRSQCVGTVGGNA